jgi:biotin operon repressor
MEAIEKTIQQFENAGNPYEKERARTRLLNFLQQYPNKQEANFLYWQVRHYVFES